MSTITNLAGRVLSPVVSAVSAVGSFYTEMNPSTLSGAIDIIVVEQEDKTLMCSPFHVRFGKLKILRPSEKLVDVSINGKQMDIQMKMGDAGECFFVVESENPVPSEYATSPIPQPVDLAAEEMDSFVLNDAQGEVTPMSTSPKTKQAPIEIHKRGDTEQSTEMFPMDPLEAVENVMDKKLLGTSPPANYSWAWGGLPEKQDDWDKESQAGSEMVQNDILPQRKLGQRASTPVLKSRHTQSMTADEKIGRYLASLPDKSVEKKPSALSPVQALEDDGIVGISVCGPLKELQPLTLQDAHNLFKKHQVSYETFVQDPALLTDPLTVFRFDGFYHSWVTAAPCILSSVAFQKPLTQQSMDKLIVPDPEPASGYGFMGWFGRAASPPPKPSTPPRQAARSVSPVRPVSPPPEKPSKQYNFAKSLRLTSDQLKLLNLNKGINHITFSIFSSLQGKQQCSAKIFFWDHKTKIVISDVDGTITKSDVLGHVFTMVGRDWTHAGVANLYTNIHKNGYQFLYLTSRAIGQASYTRDYLAKVEQDRQQLPEGPLLLSPDRLIRAFTREVILRKPEEFKIACLRDIKRLFGKEPCFYAGFGNRITDALSYRSVDVPPSRIFTVDPSGELKLELIANFKSSYIQLNETVDQVFPNTATKIDPDFNDFSFWNQPPVIVPIPGEEFVDSDSDDDIDKIKDVPY
ncbi:Lipin/Ned1/Smp2-domain-containing protein [Gorgonomyces haynaldii]|nr:Lipin/Ned1/Smp2-domain-containing protein [Gorgonomyces haynaldii]